ncbi:MAG: GMC family oxidoreductase N-terminal domain-containing protein [bacterium]
MSRDPDVVVVGAGADGPALAWALGKLGISVLVLEAGPWHGHANWPRPHQGPGSTSGSSSPEKLSSELLESQFTGREYEMNNVFSGKFRWGPADRRRAPWFRVEEEGGMTLQVAGVGGTTLHYFGNHPRAYPYAFREQDDWPIGYEELVPYYQLLEKHLPVKPAPTTPKDEVFYQGCRKAGWDLLDGKNITGPGYRPMPNAVLQPDDQLSSSGPKSYRFPDVTGSTLTVNEYQGDALPRGAPVALKSKRSSNVAFIPQALATGNVTVQPNSFVTNVLTDDSGAAGVEYRNTWTDEKELIQCDNVVLAGGCVETPRLWLKSDLPDSDEVGRGLTTHWLDFVSGTFSSDTLNNLIDQSKLKPYTGQSGSARLDFPGLGAVAVNSFHPGITAGTLYGFSQKGINEDSRNSSWDSVGKLAGSALKRKMAKYENTLTLIIHTDDRPHPDNRVTLDPNLEDKYGQIPRVNWSPHEQDSAKRTRLAELGSEVLRAAGAESVHRSYSAPIQLHLQSSMRMGAVTDETCEARSVNGLFIADHSVLPNSLGGPNPTHTGQALALRTAGHIADKYFPDRVSIEELLEEFNVK